MKKVIKIAVPAILVIAVILAAVHASGTKAEEVKDRAGEIIYSQLAGNPVYGREWQVIALAADGYEESPVMDEYYSNLEKYLKEHDGVLSEKRYTEYARVILAVAAIRKDPADVAGYDLTRKLEDAEKVEQQGINGPIWALMALHEAGYEGEVIDRYVEYVLSRQLKSGGWALLSDQMDVDVIAMAIRALEPYACTEDLEKAYDALRSAEKKDGTFGETAGADSSAESTAQAILTLSPSADLDQEVKGLLKFADRSGEFLREGEADAMSTVQGYMALTAYVKNVEAMKERGKEG